MANILPCLYQDSSIGLTLFSMKCLLWTTWMVLCLGTAAFGGCGDDDLPPNALPEDAITDMEVQEPPDVDIHHS